MRSDELYLRDIQRAAEDLAILLGEMSATELSQNMPARRAILQALTEIGEASARLSGELRTKHSDVPWKLAIGLRNHAVHAYFGVDWEIIRETVINDIPPLREKVLRILREAFPEG